MPLVPGVAVRACAMFALIALTGCAAPLAHDASPQEGLNLLLQGDAKAALDVFDRIDPAQVTPKRTEAIACIRDHFERPLPHDDLDPEAAAVLSAYERYWRAVMMKRETPEQGEAHLLAALNRMPMLADAPDHASIDSVTEYLVTALARHRLHAITGKTQPYYELMIWRSEEPRSYDIDLPEERVTVKVVLMSGFASFGWAGFATCGVAQTGGWAKPDALYAVRSSYDLESETFHVSYLAHEGQHFADYAKYPRLEQPELEYRAKLTELALSQATTRDLLEKFATLGGTDRAVPHAYANRQVTLALHGVALDGVKDAAAAKLRESTEMLRRLGPATATRFLR